MAKFGNWEAQAKQLQFSKCHSFVCRCIRQKMYQKLYQKLALEECFTKKAHLVYHLPQSQSHITSSKNQQSQIGLFPQTKYPQRECEECTRAVFSFLTQQFLMHIHLQLNLTTDRGKHRAATQNPKGSEIIYRRKAVQMLHLYIIYLQNIVINGRVNNIKNSIKAFLAFTQHLLIEALT